MERAKAKSIEIPAQHGRETSTEVPRGVPGTASSSTRALSFPLAAGSETVLQAWPAQNGAPPFPPADLLTLKQLEPYVHMKSSNIYRLIAQKRFPAPLSLGGSKWIRAEVDEYIQRCKDERDRQRGENKFAPRSAILSNQQPALNGSIPGSKPGSPAVAPPSTIRILGPEIVEALRLLKLDIPELSLDPTAWNVSLAVVKVELASSQPAKQASKHKKQ